MGIFKKDKINPNKIPTHVAFIIDGNGRWAKKRGLIRSMGHRVGFDNVKTILNEVHALGIKHMSVYAFSTENWNRPQEEVDFLMDLFREMLSSDYLSNLSFKPKLNVCGDPSRFAPDIQELIKLRTKETENNTDLVFNLCINYGGRSEIVNAVNNIIKDGKKKITIEEFSNYLYTAGQPDPDLIIRTSGEYRMSNFMLWQMAYSEFIFPKTYWPSFTKKDLYKCIINFQKRNRRFGAIKK